MAFAPGIRALNGFFKLVLLASIVMSSASAQAGLLSLSPSTTAQITSLLPVMAADVAYRSDEGPSSMARVFGIEIGVTATATDLSSVAASLGGTSAPPFLPGGTFDLDIGLPANLGIELGVMPGITYQGVYFSTYGGDIRWNLSNLHPGFMFDAALRGMATVATISTTQVISSVTVTPTYNATIFGGLLTVGKRFALIEPYANLGAIYNSSSVAVTGTVDLLGNTVPAGTTTYPGTAVGLWAGVGVQFHLSFVNITAEYDNIYWVHTLSAKVGFRF